MMIAALRESATMISAIMPQQIYCSAKENKQLLKEKEFLLD
jgi:hypothetical protein